MKKLILVICGILSCNGIILGADVKIIGSTNTIYISSFPSNCTYYFYMSTANWDNTFMDTKAKEN